MSGRMSQAHKQIRYLNAMPSITPVHRPEVEPNPEDVQNDKQDQGVTYRYAKQLLTMVRIVILTTWQRVPEC